MRISLAQEITIGSFAPISRTMVPGVGGGFLRSMGVVARVRDCHDVLGRLTPFLQTLNTNPVNQNVYGERSSDSTRFLPLLPGC